VYHQKHSSFHKIRTNLIESVSYAYGNSYLVILHIDFQIHKSLGSADSRGFCCCSRQSASEKLRQHYYATSRQSKFSVAHCCRSRLLRHTYLDEIQVAYRNEAECVLPQSLAVRRNSRQRAGSRSGIKHLRPGQKS